MSNLFIGLMSGTSVDGIDAALVEFDAQQLHVHATYCHPWPAEVRMRLLHSSQQAPEQITLAEVACLEHETAVCFAEAVAQLLALAQVSAQAVTAIGNVGQTICHQPLATPPYTWQVGNPSLLAQLTGIPVVAGLRQSDMAAGGQGAPLAPALHRAYLHSATENRVVLNLGGIANITVLPATQMQSLCGFDTGPANALLDAWSLQQRGEARDEAGQWAAQGQVHAELLQLLLADPYFQQTPPKTTGRDYFNLAWLHQRAGGLLATLSAVDVQATLTALTAHSIAQAILAYPVQCVLACGGGVHNAHLMHSLQTLLACPVQSTSNCGLDPDWVEAICFAWFAWQRWQQQPVDLTSITGAKQPQIMGGVFY